MADRHKKKSSVVIVGAGFAGFNAARELSRLIGATTEIVVINSTDVARGISAESVPLDVNRPPP